MHTIPHNSPTTQHVSQELDLSHWEAEYHADAALSAIAEAERHLAAADAAQQRRRELELLAPEVN